MISVAGSPPRARTTGVARLAAQRGDTPVGSLIVHGTQVIAEADGHQRSNLRAEAAWTGGVTSQHPILTDPNIGCWSTPPAVTCGILRGECEMLMCDRKQTGSSGQL